MDEINFKLLGKSGFKPPVNPEDAVIETFPNGFKERSYLIQFECSDFTSLCPVTGQPDFAEITIKYSPAELCVETKSLKYYLHSFRDYKSFNEKVVNTILNDLVKACNPKWMQVRGAFAARGGIKLTTVAEHPDLDLSKVREND
jgi:7-cyano-7-deazaguanine reductase